jgi:preprotein translocase subunit YajC
MSPMFTFVLFGFLILMIMTTVLSGRKEKKRRAALMASLGKLDRVQTSAGIIGTITELKDDEVVLRVDEASNTRIRFNRAAIASVLERGPRSGAEAASAP